MEEFIVYILKSGLCLGIFLMIYALLLRPTTFFKFNRAFLISGLIASFIIPGIRYTYDVFVAMPNITETVPVVNSNILAVQESPISPWSIIFSVYIIGIIILVIRNFVSYAKLKKLIKNGEKSEAGSFKIIENIDIKSPFTILNYILINTKNLSNVEKDLILKHEITHISQKHWVDLFCSEFILLLQWFNPLTWIYVKLLKENHEFLADKAVIDSGISPAVYQAVLINQRFQGQVFSFSNSFNYSKPLSRLAMIKKAKSSPWKRIGALIIIPVFGLFIWASAEPNYIIMQKGSFAVLEDENTEDLNLTIDTLVTYIAQGEAVKITKDETRTDIIKDSEKPVIRIIGRGSTDSLTTSGKLTKIDVLKSENKPIFVVDGKKEDYLKMMHLDANLIDNMSVLKDDNAVAIYGDEAKNGVIVINTKEYVKKHPEAKSEVRPKPIKQKEATKISVMDLEEKLLIIDNKEVTTKEFSALNVNDIQSISVIKDASAANLYGDKGKNGVIIITTKEKLPV